MKSAEASNTASDISSVLARASTLYERGRFIEARHMLLRAQGVGTDTADFGVKLGWCCLAIGAQQEGIHWMTSAVTADPKSVEARFGLATALASTSRGNEAKKQLKFLLTAQPQHYQSLVQLGEIELAAGDVHAAEAVIRDAIAAQPRNPIGWLVLNTVLQYQGRSSEAAQAVETAQGFEEETGIDVENFVNLAVVRSDAGRFDEARMILEANLPTKPGSNAHLAYAFVLLRMGLLREGWSHYEFRLMQSQRLQDRPRYRKPVWTGQPLRGRTILLRREQGFGDAIQFLRYAPLLKLLGATVWLQIGHELRGLASQIDGVDRVFGDEDVTLEFDYYVHIASLPGVFGTQLATIPARVPYIRASNRRLKVWAARLGDIREFKVALVWAGQSSHPRDRERSIALTYFAPLAKVPGVRLFSLQKGNASGDLASMSDLPIEDLSSDLIDFDDTAAALHHMDLVITVDTAVAHLAGAMAKRVWVILPTTCDFRWLAGRDDSPWYPSMRLYRQSRRGDWEGVVERAVKDLASLVDGSRDGSREAHRAESTKVVSTPMWPRPLPWEPMRTQAPCSAVAHTRYGIVHYWPEERLVGDALRWYGQCLQAVVDTIIALVVPGATIVETGAGVGFHSLALASAIGPRGHLILYEGRSLYRRVLSQNLAFHEATNVTIMRRDITASGAHDDTPPETIDALALERLDLLKINFADSAATTLANAGQTIWRHRPLLFFSGFEQVRVDEVLQSARDFGYRSFRRDVPWFDSRNFNGREENIFADVKPEPTVISAPEEQSFAAPVGYTDIS